MATLAARAPAEDRRAASASTGASPSGAAKEPGAAAAAARRRCRCKACHLRSCQPCRDFYANTADWMCSACVHSGEPLPSTESSRRPSRRRSLGAAVRRAWTISSGSSPRWSGPRREVREYSSLPRHRSAADYPSLHHGDQVHTDSGVGTQDEAEHAEHAEHEPLDLVRTMLERARQREDALLSVAVDAPIRAGGRAPAAPGSTPSAPRPAARPVSLSLLGLGPASTATPAARGAAGPPPSPGASTSPSAPSSDPFPRRHAVRTKSLRGRRRRAAAPACPGASNTTTTTTTPQTPPPPQQQPEWGSPCMRTRRQFQDAGGALPPSTGAAAAADADPTRTLLEGDDFRLVFISSDSSSRDEDEPRSEEDDDDLGDCLSTSSGGVGPALDDCDWDYFEPSVAVRDESSPVLRRHRYPRAFLDGSPSSSDCSSSGWAHHAPHHAPRRDWLSVAGLGDQGLSRGGGGGGGARGMVPGVVLGLQPGSSCCRSPQHSRRGHWRLDTAAPPLPPAERGDETAATATAAAAAAATAAAGSGTGTSTTGQVRPIPGPSEEGLAPAHSQAVSVAAVAAGAGRAAAVSAVPTCVSGCASCSLVPILVPIPVPVPVLVPFPQPALPAAPACNDDADDAMRPHATGGGGGRRRRGGRGRRSKNAFKTAAPSTAPAGAAPAPGADGGRRVSRSSSVAEDSDNGVVLVTFRHLKEDAKAAQDPVEDQADGAAEADDGPPAGEQTEAGPEWGGQDDKEGGDHREGNEEDQKSSCASTSSSDEDTNVDFDSEPDVEDDSDDEEVSRTYRLRDGATLTQDIRSEDYSDSSCSSSNSGVGGEALGSAGEDDDEDSDSRGRGRPFRQVFVVNEPAAAQEHGDVSRSRDPGHRERRDRDGAALSKAGRASGTAEGPGRCAARRPRAAPPPPPTAAPAAPPPTCHTSQVPDVACSGTEAEPGPAERGAGGAGVAVTADAASGESAPAPARSDCASRRAEDAVEADPAAPESADDDPPGLSTTSAEPSDGMRTVSTISASTPPDCRPSAPKSEGAAESAELDMFGETEPDSDGGVAALNKEVIGVVSPAELARLGGHMECLSVIECAAAADTASTSPTTPVALKDILRDELLRPEAEMQPPSRRGSSCSSSTDGGGRRGEHLDQDHGEGEGEFSGTESMELSPACHDRDNPDPDLDPEPYGEHEPPPPQPPPPQQQQSVERSAAAVAAVEGVGSAGAVSPLGCAGAEAAAAAAAAATAAAPCLAAPAAAPTPAPASPGTAAAPPESAARPRSPDEEAVVRRAARHEGDVEVLGPKYTSLVMITPPESPVSVSVGPPRAPAVTLLHTNLEEDADDEDAVEEEAEEDDEDDEDAEAAGDDAECPPLPPPRRTRPGDEDVQVVTGGNTMSAVICLEEGLADDDSWVEEVEPDRELDMDMEATATDTSSGDEGAEGAAADREEELRGYHRAAIDFTLHTILEESCEESETEQRPVPRTRAPSASELEKYFFFDLGGGAGVQHDAMSETNSSIYSEGLESLGTEDGYGEDANLEEQPDPAELASSRLEKYFLSGFMGFPGSSRRDSDGSVGSDSEGRPSPEQRRKRLVRARGAGRSLGAAHSSQDNLASPTQPAEATPEAAAAASEVNEEADGTEGSSTEGEGAGAAAEEPALAVDGQFDTVKRKKRKRSVGSGGAPQQPSAVAAAAGSTKGSPGSAAPSASSDERDACVSPAPSQDLAASRTKQHSRDSGFVGSCDDLLNKTASDSSASSGAASPADAPVLEAAAPADEASAVEAAAQAAPAPAAMAAAPAPPPCTTTPPATSLTRRDSFNNWSSDEETNLMMSKMRAFFKNMTGRQHAASAPQPPQHGQGQAAPQQSRRKPPQLVYFESELTRLMKTVPGIRDEQVRELVEYLSSEDTWSDSYDSSDYTSSDLESATGGRVPSKRALQAQISASCRQIISNFDTASAPAVEPDDASIVYQRLVASLSRMEASTEAAGPPPQPPRAHAAPPGLLPHASPPIFAKVMQHIGGRLVALMHEVSGQAAGRDHRDYRERYVHRRLQQKASVTSTTTEEDEDSVTDTEPDAGVGGGDAAAAAAVGGAPSGPPAAALEGAAGPVGSGVLARSRSHDLLGGEREHGQDLAAEEREASDYERFSWRGSFESALMAADSRSRLSCGGDSMVSVSVSTAAKRRSAGDLLYSHRSREHLDRVRSCGSIGGLSLSSSGPGPTAAGAAASADHPDLLRCWKARRASVPDANTSGGSADGDDDDDGEDDLDERDDGEDHDHHNADVAARSTTLPRSLQATRGAGTNSLPRLPTSGSGAAASALLKTNGLGQVQSARYRPPGYSRQPSAAASATLGNPPKRAMSAPGLGLGPHQQHPAPHPRRERRKHLQQSSHGEFSAAIRGAELRLRGDDAGAEALVPGSPTLAPHPGGPGGPAAAAYSASPSPVSSRSRVHRPGPGGSGPARDWGADEDTLASRLQQLQQLQQPIPGISQVSNLGRSDSMASVYSGAGEGRYGTVAVRGEVEFGLQYNYKQSALEIHVVQCKDLAAVDFKRNRSDPYVKVYLLPDKSKGGKRKTRVKKHTLNPYFDETLKFHINIKGLESRTLWLTVWHSDMFGRNDFLGEVMMTLENKVFDDPSPRSYPLQERTEPFEDVLSYRGDMIVALKFIPPDISGSTLGKKGKRSSKGELHVLVKEAKNLSVVRASGTCDSFCKSYLLPDKGRSSKQKTSVIRRTCNPAWNHTFIYSDVSLQELSERSLELTVWDHDRIASNEFLGGVRFNLGTGKQHAKPVDWMDSTGKEVTLWQRMLERPNLWVESSITLRPSLERTAMTSNTAT